MDTNYIIETKNLTASIRLTKSVFDLNIHVKRGEFHGLLGRNRCGRNHNYENAVGLNRATSGESKSEESLYRGMKRSCCPVLADLIRSPAAPTPDRHRENLRIFAAWALEYQTIMPSKTLLDLVGLPYKDKSCFHACSLGMGQRLVAPYPVIHDQASFG